MRIPSWLLWVIPLALHSANALAWGLATHLYFSQLLIWAVPLLDTRFRDAARRLPQLAHADSPETRAIALGYASHLFVDIIAHNHFVPAHERMWLKLPMVTHASAEWAMDAHIAAHLFAMPHTLIRDHHALLAEYVEAEFDCPQETAKRTLRYLRRATQFLYGSQIHHTLYAGARCMDRRLVRRFDYYVAETSARLPEINRLLVGEAPHWRADFPCPEHARHLQGLSLDELRGHLPLPASLFA